MTAKHHLAPISFHAHRKSQIASGITLLADLFFLWVLVYFGFGGLGNAWQLLRLFGPLSWLLLAAVVVLLVLGSDYRQDIPLFAAGVLLGYWGEWWGTTRGIWWYWNGATPPLYLPPLWGIGLLTVYRAASWLAKSLPENPSRLVRRLMIASFVLLPLLALLPSWPRLAAVDWRGRLDNHFIAGIVLAAGLISYRFDLRRMFAVYLCGLLFGYLYEALGTSWGEWTYITREIPPLWIAPLWGLAAAAMTRLADLLSWGLGRVGRWLKYPVFKPAVD